MTKKSICMITVNNLDYDTRILNEARTLSSCYDVTIITPGCYDKSILNNCFFTVKVIKGISHLPRDLARCLNIFKLSYRLICEDTDIYHTHDLHGLCTAILPAMLKRKILIYDSHELWSNVSLFGVWKIFRWPFSLLEKILIRRVKAIITVNDSIAKILIGKYHKPTVAIYNYPVLEQNFFKYLKDKNSLIKDKNSSKKKIAIYLGAFQAGRGLNQIIRATQYLDKSIQILFIGYGRKKNALKSEIRRLGLENKVKLLPAVLPKEIIRVISQADIGLCLIENASLSYYYSTPNKLFQYIAAEVPILGSNFPEFKKIILGDNVGEVVNPSKPELIARKIKQMTDMNNQKTYRKNLKNLAKKKYNWEIEANKLREFYQNKIIGETK